MSVPTSSIINLYSETKSGQNMMKSQGMAKDGWAAFSQYLSQESKNNNQKNPDVEQVMGKSKVFGKDNIMIDSALFEKSYTLMNKNDALRNASVQQIKQIISANPQAAMAVESKNNVAGAEQGKMFAASKVVLGADNAKAGVPLDARHNTAGAEQGKMFKVSEVVIGEERANIARQNNYDKARIDYQRTNAIGMLTEGMKGGSGTTLLDMARNSVSLRNLQTVVAGFSLSSQDYLASVSAKISSANNKSTSGEKIKNESQNTASLGSLSAKFESGSDGISSIGYDRNGGTSYGKYQIASRVGSMDKFLDGLDTSAPDIAERLRQAGPSNTGSRRGGMADEWRKIAKEEPERFEKLQEEFIHDNYYKPALAAIREKSSLKEINISPAMEEVIWSTAIQHGPSAAARIFTRAADSVGYAEKGQADNSKMISAVYDIRTRQFGSSTEQVRNAVHNRLEQEKTLALDMLKGEKNSMV